MQHVNDVTFSLVLCRVVGIVGFITGVRHIAYSALTLLDWHQEEHPDR